MLRKHVKTWEMEQNIFTKVWTKNWMLKQKKVFATAEKVLAALQYCFSSSKTWTFYKHACFGPEKGFWILFLSLWMFLNTYYLYFERTGVQICGDCTIFPVTHMQVFKTCEFQRSDNMGSLTLWGHGNLAILQIPAHFISLWAPLGGAIGQIEGYFGSKIQFLWKKYHTAERFNIFWVLQELQLHKT